METAESRPELEPNTVARSQLYLLLRLAFAFPDPDFFEAVRDGDFSLRLAELCSRLPYDVLAQATLGLGRAGTDYADFEAEYIRLFDVGAAGPPCPLYGGVYVGDRMKVMEDATRFYNFFHLRLSPQVRELPDHITTQLEFMHYLTYREAEVRPQGIDPAPLLRAERDFLARHLCRWVPRLRERLANKEAIPFFPALVDFTLAFLRADHDHATALAT
jgi:putative dimethyl sulfoxide reductase chaperone